MRKRRIILTILICTCVLSGSLALADDRLGDDVRPIFQAIRLTVDPAQNSYSGSVRIELEVRQATDHFRFHSRGHELRRVALTGAGGEVAVGHEAHGEDAVVVRAGETLAAGRYELRIDYEAPFSTQISGLFRTQDDSGAYVHTIFQPADARRAFPCWDEPAFKIPFQVTLTHPEDLLAISNTPEEKVTAADGWRTVVFRKTPPLPTYDVAVAVGPFETVPITGLSVPGRVVTAPGRSALAATAAAMTPPILRALEEYFGSPHPYAKLDLLAVVGFPDGAFEAPGAVIFGESLLLLDPASAPPDHRPRLAETLAHEIAHMWLGNLVTLAWWDDVWLNEAFATWMGAKIAHQAFPDLGVDVRSLRATQRALELDAQAGAAPIRRAVDAADEAFAVNSTLTYYKGSQVLGMFESWVGAEPFRQAVNAYLGANAWGNATSEDFLRQLDESTGKDFSAAFRTFIEQPGFPLVEIEAREGRLRIRQERFRNYGATAEDLLWQVPVTLKLDDGSGSRSETLLLQAASQSVELKAPPEWVLPNAEAGGYFRWSLPADELTALAGKAGDVATPNERLEIVANAGALLQAGQLAGDGYLELLGGMAGDPSPKVLGAVVDGLERVKTTFVTAELEEAYAAYLRRTLAPALERVGLRAAPGEDGSVAELRGRLYFLLGHDGRDETVRRHAREAVEAVLAGGSMAPELLRPALRLAALEGGPELFQAYRKRLAEAEPMHRGDYAWGLAAFASAELRRQALNGFLEGSLGINEFATLGFVLGGADASAVLVLRWTRDHYPGLTQKMPPMFLAFLPLLTGGSCSTEHLKSVEAFFAEPLHRVPGTEAQLAQVAEKVRDCAGLRQREGEAVAGYLTTSRHSGKSALVRAPRQ